MRRVLFIVQSRSHQSGQRVEGLPGCPVLHCIGAFCILMAWSISWLGGPERLKDADTERRGHVTCVSGENCKKGLHS